MFTKLLIANRGEIACRILRTAHKMGMQVVAVYSDADKKAQHVLQADEAIHIGQSPALESYLDIAAVMQAVRESGANALHPGYGFLAENAQLARACEGNGCSFVGPSAAAIETMGSKIAAKRIVGAAGTPIVPGYEGDDQSTEKLREEAEKIGYPLLVKASAGGGGKGMRLVENGQDFVSALQSAKREALNAFGDDQVLLEKFLTRPKHIEIQIMADTFGNTVALFERDCSVQRRHQKVIEEAPAPLVNNDLRQQMMVAAVTAAQSIDYVGAGTIEFICDDTGFYFMEMNTRLQVEHPVTEAITGLDLVEWQLRVAAGEALTFTQDDLSIKGHAVEARVYAENPKNKFLPSTGDLLHVNFSDRARIDSGIITGDTVSVHYDPMLAKLTSWGVTRAAAIDRLKQALSESELVGVDHNIGYLINVLNHESFLAGDYTTALADLHHDQLVHADVNHHLVATVLWLCERDLGDAWDNLDGFRINLPGRRRIVLAIAQTEYECHYDGTGVVVTEAGGGNEGTRSEGARSEGARSEGAKSIGAKSVGARSEGTRISDVSVTDSQISFTSKNQSVHARVVPTSEFLYVVIDGVTEKLVHVSLDQQSFENDEGYGDRITSPMPGQVVNVLVCEGDRVNKGDSLVVVEAMKMEHAISAPKSGKVITINCAAGARVEEDLELVVMEYDD